MTTTFRFQILVKANSGVSAKFKDVKMVVFDFDGVFTDNTVYVDQNGVESVRCWRGDGLGLDLLRKCLEETISRLLSSIHRNIHS